MKEFFKNLGTGLIFFLVSGCTMGFCAMIYYSIIAIPTCSGWEAIGLAITCLIVTWMVFSLIYAMGLIPNDTIDRLKKKIAELEEEDAE